MTFEEAIGRGTLLLDGDHGLSPAQNGSDVSPVELLCLTDPAAVANAHASFAQAGAGIIRTNSLNANAPALARFGMQDRVNEINWTASQLAREAVRGTGARVAGCVGEPPERDAEVVLREQIGALLDGGAQLILFQGFRSLPVLRLALEVKYALHHCPAICLLQTTAGGKLADGTDFADAAERLAKDDADVIGVYWTDPWAGRLPFAIPTINLPVAFVLSSADAPPGATFPDAASYALAASQCAEAGVAIFGGGRGVGPLHTRAAAAALSNDPS